MTTSPSIGKRTSIEQSLSCEPSLKRQDRTRESKFRHTTKNFTCEAYPHIFRYRTLSHPIFYCKGYMIGCRMNAIHGIPKWTLLRTSILMGHGQGLLPKMHKFHFRYTSFTPLAQLGLNLNQKGNLFLSSPLSSFLVHLFHTRSSVETKLQLERKSLPQQSSLQGLEEHLCVFSTYVQTMGTLWHAFEAANIEKKVAFEDVLHAKVEVLCLKNELHQAQT